MKLKKKCRIGFNKVLLTVFCLTNFIKGYSQYIVEGLVTNNKNEPALLVNVFLEDSSNQIVFNTITGNHGEFTFKSISKGNYTIHFSGLGYKKTSINIDVNNNIDISIKLEEKTIQLNEVIVQAERPISIKKDTINFKTKFFATGTEQTVEDLLKMIPGLQIDAEGTIKVNNQEIEKIMVDGDDFFEKGYKILSKNMPAYPIEEVEVLKNYSNNRLLKGVEESNKVALNLKLDEKSKRIWFGNAEMKMGNNNFYELKSNLMNFGKKNKYYFLTNLNNIGYNAIGDVEHLIHPFKMNEPAGTADNQQANSLLALSQPDLDFKRSRFNFNNAELLSLNAIFNPTEKLKIKTLGFFNSDETDFYKNSTDAISTNGTNFINTEGYRLRNKYKIAFGKVDISYNISKNQMIEAATKFNYGNFNDNSSLVFNGTSTIEQLQHDNKLIDQKISYTNKVKDNKVLLISGRFINEELPENYTVNQIFFKDFFPQYSNANNVGQTSNNKMQFIAINGHILDRKENDDLLEVQFGNELRKDVLKTTFSIFEGENLLDNPNGFQNKISYQVNNLYVKGKYLLNIDPISFVGKLDIHQLFNKRQNNGISNFQNPFFINPSLGLNWKINEKNKIKTSYAFNTTNATVLDVYTDYVLTGYRSFTKGTDSFNQLNASNLVFNHTFGNWSDQFFANTFILYAKNHDFFSTNTIIEQNFSQTEKILIEDREFLSLNSKLDYFFKFISSNIKLDLGYSSSEFKNIVNNSGLRNITFKNYNYGLELRSGFKGVFNYHIGTKWSTSQIITPSSNSFTNNISFLDLSFVFNEKIDMQLQSERYYFGNLTFYNTYYFLDFDIQYKLIQDKLTLGLTGKNIFNSRQFRNYSITDIGYSTAEYRLLPRFVLFKSEFRF